MPIEQDVADRLLVVKALLGRVRFLPMARPDRVTLARNILTSHDAGELALAAIARHLGRLPQDARVHLMDYFPAIRQEHPGEEVAGREYFSQLNRVRVDVKHHGIFPDPQQWHTVGERTYGYVSNWCERYLGLRLDELDESALISNPDVKRRFDSARQALERNDYRRVLEELAYAMETLFRGNRALRNLVVGMPRAEDAIKLSAFGVHANDFLALQEFLPYLTYAGPGDRRVKWEQEQFGHPANWTREAGEFCLRTFVSVALRIQDAEWIPGAIDFNFVYEHRITAITDGVEIVQYRRPDLLGPAEKAVVRVLRQGESVRGRVSRVEDKTFANLLGREPGRVYSIWNLDEWGWGQVEADKVHVACVPRDHRLVREHFPGLPELDFDA